MMIMSIHLSLSVPAVCPYSICERVLGNRFTNRWLWKPNYASDDLGQVWYGTGIHKPSIETTPYSKRTEKEGNTLGSALLHADTRTVRKQDCTQSIRKNNNSLFFTIFLNKRKTLEWFFFWQHQKSNPYGLCQTMTGFMERHESTLEEYVLL